MVADYVGGSRIGLTQDACEVERKLFIVGQAQEEGGGEDGRRFGILSSVSARLVKIWAAGSSTWT